MFATLFLPAFRLQARLLSSLPPGTPPSLEQIPPIALLQDHSHQGTVLECSPQAAFHGVHPGMTASQAMARCTALSLLNACPQAEAEAAQQLLHFSESLSPRVQKIAPERWLLDVRSLTHRTLAWEPWAAGGLSRLALSLRLHGRMGLAPSPALSWCAARRAHPTLVIEEPAPFIESLSFAELGVSEGLKMQLDCWGIATLGELLRIPKQEALERLGPEAAPLWEIARDSRESVLRLESFPEPLLLLTELEHPLESTEPLLFLLHRMVEQLASRLRLLQRVAAAMHLQLRLECGPPYARELPIPAPSCEESVLLRILQTHLDSLRLDSPICAVQLHLIPTRPTSQQLALFENPLRDPNRFGETLARLQALVGPEGCGVPAPPHSHHPEAFQLLDPLPALTSSFAPVASLPKTAPAPALGLPLRRFLPPLPARVQLRLHRPDHVACSAFSGRVVDSLGPYRLSGCWWDTPRWQSEEWDIALEGKHRGLYRLSRSPHSPHAPWRIEGCYETALWPETAPSSPPSPPTR
jgi:protein ImuB